eukprot:TRINITY_DN5824_c0_g1_i4.p1 TRINITY_DN5824_c0_g1~~TRINITY_DN5824_c0_g1_i4.p1  ORF type:complete len:965 (-),score=185.67 TRINITY_DN5824_c0_g1_i4:213-3107(-)
MDSVNATSKMFKTEINNVQSLNEIERVWENDVLLHIQSIPVGCLVLWISDKIMEQEVGNYREPNICIFATTPENLENYLRRLSFLSTEKYEGRFRIAIACSDPVSVLRVLNSGPFDKKCIPIIVNREMIEDQETQTPLLTTLRDCVTVSSGTLGFALFVQMSSLLWIGKIDEQLNTDLAKNGVVVYSATDLRSVVEIMDVYTFWHCHCKNFRIVIVEKSIRNEVISLCYTIRIRYGCFAPILILIQDNNSYEVSSQIVPPGFQLVHNLPFIKECEADKELVPYCFMSPISWARPEILYATPTQPSNISPPLPRPGPPSDLPKISDHAMTPAMVTCLSSMFPEYLFRVVGNFVIHSISCQFLYPIEHGRSDPFLCVFVNDETNPREKSKALKKTLFPEWSSIGWVLSDVKITDRIRIEVYDRATGDTEGFVYRYIWQLISPLNEKVQTTMLLRSSDPNNVKKLFKVRGTVRLEAQWKEESSRPLSTPTGTNGHFGRPLRESLEKASSDGTMHVFDNTLATLQGMMSTEGLFRLPGGANNIQALQNEFDMGVNVNLLHEPVHDIGSLCKAYFSQLPDTLLPEEHYEAFKAVATQEDHKTKMKLTVELIDKLPLANKRVFIDLVTFLHNVSLLSETNKMTPTNLAVCWTPTIIIPQRISFCPEKMLYDSHVTTQFLAWIIEHSHTLWPPLTAGMVTPNLQNIFTMSNTNESLHALLMTPSHLSIGISTPRRRSSSLSSPVSTLPSLLRQPHLLVQRHLSVDETSNSPYLEQLKIKANQFPEPTEEESNSNPSNIPGIIVPDNSGAGIGTTGTVTSTSSMNASTSSRSKRASSFALQKPTANPNTPTSPVLLSSPTNIATPLPTTLISNPTSMTPSKKEKILTRTKTASSGSKRPSSMSFVYLEMNGTIKKNNSNGAIPAIGEKKEPISLEDAKSAIHSIYMHLNVEDRSTIDEFLLSLVQGPNASTT